MADEEQEEVTEEAAPEAVKPRPVMRHSWGGLVAGMVAVSALAGVTVGLALLFAGSRPLDLRSSSLETAAAIEALLDVSQIPANRIVATQPVLFKTLRAHFYYVEYVVSLPETVSADGLTKLIERRLFPLGVLVSREGDSLNLTLGEHRVAAITLSNPRRFVEQPRVAVESEAALAEPLTEKPLRRAAVVEASTNSMETLSQSPTSEPGASLPTEDDRVVGAWQPPTKESVVAVEARVLSVARARPIRAARPRVAIIVDDGGYGGSATDVIMSLTPRLTLSILPNTPECTALAEEAVLLGFEVMLHMPMENSTGKLAHEGQIETVMDVADMDRLVTDALRQVPGAVGINNHMGSKFTEDSDALESFMSTIDELGLYFIDSRTTAGSRAHDIAAAYSIPSARRDIFLDHEDDIDTIRMQFRELMVRAERDGTVIAICHFRPNTAAVLREMIPELRVAGIELVHASKLVQ